MRPEGRIPTSEADAGSRRETLRLAVLAAGLAAVAVLMRAPSPGFLSAPERYYEAASPSATRPAFAIAAAPAAPGALDLRLALEGVVLTEICADRPNGPVQAHAEVFVDGRPVQTLWWPEGRLSGLAPGLRMVSVALVNPVSHKVLTVDGVPLRRSLSVVVP